MFLQIRKRRTVNCTQGTKTFDLSYKAIQLRSDNGAVSGPVCLITMIELSPEEHQVETVQKSSVLLDFATGGNPEP
jgi:hypothetical protein